MRLDANENSQINPSTIVRAARAAGSQPYLPSGFQGRCKIATLHAGFGVIRGMSDKTNAQACSGVCWVRAVEPLDLDAHKKFWIPISVPDVPRTSNRLLKI